MNTEATAEPQELLELRGDALEFELRYDFVTKSAPVKRDLFLQMIQADDGGSIAEVIADLLSIYVNSGAEAELPDCFSWGGSGQFVVSGRMKALLESFDIPNLEFFSLALILRAASDVGTDRPWIDGESVSGYWLMYCFNRADFIDVEKSKVEWRKSFVGHRPPWFTRWKHLVLKSLPAEHLYGVEGNLPRRRYVSPAVRDAIRNAGLRVSIVGQALNLRDRGYVSEQ